MRRPTVLALLLVAAASSSQCSDGKTTVIGPSSGIAAGRFANTGGGSTQGGNTGTPGGGDSGPSSGSSISRLALMLVVDKNGDGRASRGDSITFAITTTQTWDHVSVVCSQNGEVVFSAERTADEWSSIALTSATWSSGAADCKATLDQVNETDSKTTTLASATFTAGA
jgi:hypothetical protein